MSGLRDELTKRLLRLGRPDRSAAVAETSVPTDPREGKQFGAYRILRSLGAGGMGHVYLALDTRLGRHTALKFLLHDLLADTAALRRLEQEARAASALNHPNILTIYEIGEVANELFIASEFVEGITLKNAIQRDAVDPDMAVRIAIQIASALQAAHSAGVIHRDLKPANVMVRPDGYVKVIDFGLAKVAGESPSGLSQTGLVVGTVDYMSPEQARGDQVDARTDLWSLGVLLYEMLGHRRPFAGETDSHVIVAILDYPAPPLPNLAALPSGVGRIVARALLKDPAKRYQAAEEMLLDLEHLGISSSHRAPIRESHVKSVDRRLSAAALLASLLILTAAWWWGFGGKDRFTDPSWFVVDSVKQITFNGRTLLSALSPDGKYLAFVVGDREGMQSLHVKQVDQPSDEVRIPSRKIEYWGLTFSPDSRSIYEVEGDLSTLVGQLFSVPVVGERSSIPLVDDVDGPVTFSPSGDRFAFVRWEPVKGSSGATQNTIEIARTDNNQLTPLFSSSAVTLMSHLAWSPKGTQVAAILRDNSAPSSQVHLTLLRVPGGQIVKRFKAWSGIGQLCWQNGARSILLTASSTTEGRSRSQLREFAVHLDITRDLTKDLSGYSSASLSADGKHLAVVKIDPRATLWLSARNDFAHGRSAFSDVQDSASLDWLDPTHLLVNSRRTGFPNLAVFRTADLTESALTTEPFLEQHAEPVPGGRFIVYSSNRSGGFHIWRYNRQSNHYLQLTFGSNYDDSPSVSPDGKWIVYTSSASTYPLLYKISMDGGTPISLGALSATNPQISPDGKWIACQIQKQPNHWTVAIIPFAPNGQTVRELPNASLPFRWSPAGDSLTSSITEANGTSNLWRIPLDGSPAEQLTKFEDQSILMFAWSRDATHLACIRLQNYSDVMLFNRQPQR